jgi:REP element-mobilizing transposase RayT
MKKYQIELEPGKFYHIFNRGNNSENIFFNEGNYKFFLRRYNEALSHLVETYAFCLLPNHFHLLILVKDLPTKALHLQDAKLLASTSQPFLQDAKLLTKPPTPSQAFHRFFTSYSKAINKQQDRHGSLFENPFKRIEVDSPDYFTNLVFYIHANPQLHGIVNDFRNYPWSSYGKIVSQAQNHSVIEWFENKENFIFFHEQKIDFETIKKFTFDD